VDRLAAVRSLGPGHSFEYRRTDAAPDRIGRSLYSRLSHLPSIAAEGTGVSHADPARPGQSVSCELRAL
jgi:hypothetical protein